MARIRMAMRDDARRLSEFARRTFGETFAPQNTPEDMEAYLSHAFSDARQLAEIEDRHTMTLLAEEDGMLVGYAQLGARMPPLCVPDRNAIELIRFYVDRDWQGRGIAQQLMEAAENAAAARGQAIWLGVWEHNPRAIAFYQKCGFADVGSHEFLLGSDRQTDRIMWRTLHAGSKTEPA
jgi:ribosomal protein S18 acetylase RimI-like enzyme